MKIVGSNDFNSCVVTRLLHNNAFTLTTLCSNGSVGELQFLRNSVTQYHKLQTLQVARWDECALASLVKCCPNLVALSVSLIVRNGEPSLLTAFLGSCSQLQRLHFDYTFLLHHNLSEIAKAFPLLQQLFLQRCPNAMSAHLVDFVCALPHLHTLNTHDVLPEAMLIEIANRGHPSLRVIDSWTKFTYGGIRQITAGLPQLTGLAIFHSTSEMHLWNDDVLEHCGALQHLRIPGYRGTTCVQVVGTVLNSVAVYCPNLRTLGVGPTLYPACGNALHNVVSNCTQLHTLYIEKSSVVGLPLCPGPVVTEHYAPLTEWKSD